jgi:Zn-dependent peptidase ImmA (M78 family)/transcriptional regulator with XRE-family HTH domain
MMHVEVKPEMLRWARERAGKELDSLVDKFPQLLSWEKEVEQPTMKQLERFAAAVHAPIGYLFLKTPPVETIPIPDFRTIGNKHINRPSPDMLETIFVCQQRQEWYRGFARSVGEKPLPFVGSVQATNDVETTAAGIRHALGFDIEERRKTRTWLEALSRFIVQADEAGVLVMCSGVVMNNNRRPLDPDEFRGFAISDDLAPLVFINGKDSKSAQMFTLAHELAHIWLGKSAVSDARPTAIPSHEVEAWCNRVAAEMLVPVSLFRNEYRGDAELRDEVRRLAGCFKVSTLVILRRIYDIGGLSQGQFWQEYDKELEFLKKIRKGSGGDFYLTQAARVSRRFARSLVVSALEGRASFTEAFRLLGVKKMTTFHELGRSLGVTC